MAIVAAQLGASFAVASVVVGTMGIGRVLSDVPAGMLARTYRRPAHDAVLGRGVRGVRFGLPSRRRRVDADHRRGRDLAVARAGFGLARHTYMTVVIPYSLRARALSTLGGLQRAGLFVGPLCGGAAIAVMGTSGAFWMAMTSSVLAGIVLAGRSRTGGAQDTGAVTRRAPTARCCVSICRCCARSGPRRCWPASSGRPVKW